MLSFGIKGDAKRCARFMEALKLITQETHVADVRSCVLHPASTTHRQLSAADLKKAGVPENLVRLSVGIENPEDILADLSPGRWTGFERRAMPIVIDSALPAYKILGGEKIFVMDKTRAVSQDIRPIEIAILNLMPTKEETETQFMRLLSNSPLQVNVTLLSTESYHGRHTAEGYLGKFYQSFRDVENKHFDGMIVTGAPVEQMDFSSVAYWDELKRIFAYTKTHVTSTIFICWGAMAALHYFYGVKKYPLKEKLFGVFTHHKVPLCGARAADARGSRTNFICPIPATPPSR